MVQGGVCGQLMTAHGGNARTVGSCRGKKVARTLSIILAEIKRKTIYALEKVSSTDVYAHVLGQHYFPHCVELGCVL